MPSRVGVSAQEFGGRDLLIVGDAMIDQHFVVDRQHNRDEKVVVRSSWRGLGGTGANTAAALQALKLPVRLATTVGNDALGDELLALLQQRGLDTSLVQQSTGVTGQAVILHEHDWRQVIVDRGVVDRPRDDLPTTGLLTYVSTPDVLAHVPEIVGSLVISVEHQMLNPSLSLLLDRADIVIANEAAYSVLTRTIETQPRLIVETRGSEGSIVHSDGHTHRIQPVPVHAIDPTGAGDAFAAGLLAAHRAGHDIYAAAARANALASYAASQHGASLTSVPEDLAQFVVTPPPLEPPEQ